jgi:hypothetical protein
LAQGGFFLGSSELIELGLLEDFRSGRLTRTEVALLLDIDERTVTRKTKKLRDHGPSGIKHGNYGKTPINRRPDSEKERAMGLSRITYSAFNLSHCYLESQGV